ncbi:hypothetical protein [Mycobacteroides abscessus]|uniref:hypothetical protein n=1 Tax=Mycobacteroides abscessus TaxID=36809 RepID=UPI0009A78E7E|nr:hypothetical protein [Mycobacteroides abscessus]RIT41394.1 hypothetical protein D2E80_23810 [Mycobacteroides abscessus]SKT62888.1 Uncharacterised protein [Mycobacteroides abscessus subsp. massiliense]SKU17712.1 Uncharacterised protein [Mycobacteroides abscessus subsp. massiliense]
MFEPLHAVRDYLATLRENFAHAAPDAILKEAVHWVIDDLDRRLRALTDVVPADAEMTKTLIIEHGNQALYLGEYVQATLLKLADLIEEYGSTLEAQIQPITQFIAEIESEGYAVDGTDVADAQDRSVSHVNRPQTQVQFEAENIARAEQATIYQRRLKLMDASMRITRDDYAQRIRQLRHIVHISPSRTDWAAHLSQEFIHPLKNGELPPET